MTDFYKQAIDPTYSKAFQEESASRLSEVGVAYVAEIERFLNDEADEQDIEEAKPKVDRKSLMILGGLGLATVAHLSYLYLNKPAES
jgi:hypothetical protein